MGKIRIQELFLIFYLLRIAASVDETYDEEYIEIEATPVHYPSTPANKTSPHSTMYFEPELIPVDYTRTVLSLRSLITTSWSVSKFTSVRYSSPVASTTIQLMSSLSMKTGHSYDSSFSSNSADNNHVYLSVFSVTSQPVTEGKITYIFPNTVQETSSTLCSDERTQGKDAFSSVIYNYDADSLHPALSASRCNGTLTVAEAGLPVLDNTVSQSITETLYETKLLHNQTTTASPKQEIYLTLMPELGQVNLTAMNRDELVYKVPSMQSSTEQIDSVHKTSGHNSSTEFLESIREGNKESAVTSHFQNESSASTAVKKTSFSCKTKLGYTLYRASIEAETTIPQQCWQVICSEENPYSFINDLHNFTTYWFQESSSACYNQVIYDNDDGMISKLLSVAPDIKIMLLNPICIQSLGLAYLENTQSQISLLPLSCRQSLCHDGGGLIYYEHIPAVLIQPHEPVNTSEYSRCIHDIKLLHSNNVSALQPEKVNVFSLDDNPISSPCPTTVIFLVRETGTHLVLPYRAPWCEILSRDTWNELFLSFYSVYQSKESIKLFECLTRKSRRWEYHSDQYTILLQYLLKRNITLPHIPNQCLEFLCDDEVEISEPDHIQNKDFKFWFNYIKNCRKTNCFSLKTTLHQCINKTSNTSDYDVQESRLANIILTNSSYPYKHFLHFSMEWSCPFGNGDGQTGRLRGEALANLWLLNTTFSRSCQALLCGASASKLDYNVTVFHVMKTVSENDVSDCKRHASKFDIAVIEQVQIFSYATQVQNTIVFVIGKSFIERNSLGVLSILHSTSNMPLSKCCQNFPSDIYMYNYNGIRYYRCYAPYNITGKLDNCLEEGNLWTIKYITKKSHLVIFRKAETSDFTQALFQWLASLNINSSKFSHTFITDLPTVTQIFRNNIIFSCQYENFSGINFQEFKTELISHNVVCNTTKYITVCHRPGGVFPNTFNNKGYLVVLHECPISVGDRDKIILLLLTMFRNTGLTIEHLCYYESLVVMVPYKAKRITYATKGSHTEYDKVLNTFKKLSSGWKWTRDAIINPWELVRKGWCVRINEPQQVFSALGFANCLYYSNNNVTIFFQVPNESYYVALFQLTAVQEHNGTLSLTNWTTESNMQHTLSFENSDVYGSGKIFINDLMRNPMAKELLQYYPENKHGVVSSAKVFSKILIRSVISNNSQCIEDLSNFKFYIYETDSILSVGPVPSDFMDSSCFLSLPQETIDTMQFYLTKNMTTHNKFWTTCMYNMILTLTTDQPIIIDWDYLPSTCRIKEGLLLGVSSLISIITVSGNVLVLFVIFKSNLIQETAFICRASLAIADLLLGLIPGTLATYDHASLMTGRLSLRSLDPDSIHASFKMLSSSQPQGFQQVRFERQGYAMISGIIFNISTNVSLLTLALMSIERYRVVTSKPLRRKQVLIGTGVTWGISIVLAMLVNFRQDGWRFAGYFDPITKLTVSIGSSSPSVSLIVFYMQVTILGAAALLIIFCTLITVILFSTYNYKMKKMTIHSAKRNKDIWKTTQTFLYMVALFAMATLPLGMDILYDLSINNPTGHFFAWWLFMAAASWNWALYSFSGKKFSIAFRKLLCRKRKPEALAYNGKKDDGMQLKKRQGKS